VLSNSYPWEKGYSDDYTRQNKLVPEAAQQEATCEELKEKKALLKAEISRLNTDSEHLRKAGRVPQP